MITIEPVFGPSDEVAALVEELEAVLGAAYEAHQRHGLALAELFEPHIRFFVARLDGRAMGCGGVALFADYAEVKRMYTRPQARGRGLAKALLSRIEDEAAVAGKAVLGLETGVYQPEALGLYRGAGFQSCGAFGPYVGMAAEQIETSLFFEKPVGAQT